MIAPAHYEKEFPISPSKGYATQLATWKWEKRHWLLAIALGCLTLWYFGSQIKEITLFQTLINWLPAIGSACFATEAITKLIK